ncbi:MAG: urease accessory protein UreD [Ginsengibacter sp.]
MTAELDIQAALRNNITFLEKAYCTTPFKIANITENKKDNTLRLMLMSSSPGILDGDVYNIKIHVAKHCSLHLQTQSYQRLFNMKVGASQNMEVHLEEGASFWFIPHPSVPHESSIFAAKNKILLSDNCDLIWGEVLTCGRKLSGEVFLLSKYHNVTEIFLNNKLIIKENLLVQPSVVNVNLIGQLESYTHQATLIYLNEKASIKILIKEITAFLSIQNEIIFGITAAPVNGLIIRLLGYKAEQLFDCLKTISEHHLTKNKFEHAG